MSDDFDFPDEVESFGTNPEDFAVGEDGTVRIGGIQVAGGGGFDNTDHVKAEFEQGRLTADEREEQAAVAREAAGDREEDNEEPAAARRTPVDVCQKCGRTQFLESITPLGMSGNKVAWNCDCGATLRADADAMPEELLDKGQEQDEILDLVYYHAGLQRRKK